MSLIIRGLAFVIITFSCGMSVAAIDLYQFDDPEKKERFYHLIDELRCTVCQNQTIGDSNADLAKDLRDKVYNMIHDGKTDAEIKQYMVDRFTDFVLYRPPVKSNTYLLWAGPFIVLGIALVFLIRFIRRRTNPNMMDFDEQQHQRVQSILQQDKDNSHD